MPISKTAYGFCNDISIWPTIVDLAKCCLDIAPRIDLLVVERTHRLALRRGLLRRRLLDEASARSSLYCELRLGASGQSTVFDW